MATLPEDEYGDFRKKSFAYTLWLSASSIQRGWNTMLRLNDEIVPGLDEEVKGLICNHWPVEQERFANAFEKRRNNLLDYVQGYHLT